MSKDSGYLQGEERGIQALLIQLSVCILYHNLKQFFKRWKVREKTWRLIALGLNIGFVTY